MWKNPSIRVFYSLVSSSEGSAVGEVIRIPLATGCSCFCRFRVSWSGFRLIWSVVTHVDTLTAGKMRGASYVSMCLLYDVSGCIRCVSPPRCDLREIIQACVCGLVWLFVVRKLPPKLCHHRQIVMEKLSMQWWQSKQAAGQRGESTQMESALRDWICRCIGVCDNLNHITQQRGRYDCCCSLFSKSRDILKLFDIKHQHMFMLLHVSGNSGVYHYLEQNMGPNLLKCVWWCLMGKFIKLSFFIFKQIILLVL